MAAKTQSLFGPVTFPSGDVSQPWSWWYQFAPVTINQMKTPRPDTETHLVRNVASYGRQLGRMQDVLAILIDRLDPQSLDSNGKAAVNAYQEMSNEIAAAKLGLPAPTHANAAAMVATLKDWKEREPALFEQVRQEFLDALKES